MRAKLSTILPSSRRTKTGETKGIGWVIQAIRGEVSKAEKASEKSGRERYLFIFWL